MDNDEKSIINHDNHVEDEVKLLASLSASIADQATYEDDVIRQVTHQLVPSLPSKAPLGFPSLVSLAPTQSKNIGSSSSFNPVDLPHIHKVLGKVRQEINNNENVNGCDLLFLKEQILLSYLKNNAGYRTNELPLRVDEDCEPERKRSLHCLNEQNRYNLDNEKGPVSSNFWKLETTTANSSHKRIPMMKRKRIQQNVQVRTDDDENQLKIEQSKEYKDHLHQLRLERQKRKDERRKRSNIGRYTHGTDSSENDESDESCNGDDHESRVETVSGSGNDIDDTILQSSLSTIKASGIQLVDANSVVESKASLESQVEAAEQKHICCPLCNKELEISDMSEGDTVLSLHIDACQRNSSRPTRRAAALAAITLKQVDNACSTSDEQNFESLMMEEVKTTRKRRIKLKDPAKPAIRKNRRIAVSRKIVGENLTAAHEMDDFLESSYEDRVDDWIEFGLGRMKIMKERDDSEDLPGEEIYPNGLVIPAWVNDNMFGYQREALRWLWNLHYQKQAGGILGDEMGLGKTVQICAFLGAAAASRKLNSVLTVAPATMLQHWLSELAKWAPGLRRVIIHQSGDSDGFSRTISKKLLQGLSQWLKHARSDRVNEPIDEDDINSTPAHAFCGSGYVIVTTYENLRRNANVYIAHEWTYLVLDEAQKIRNPDADITLTCKRIRTPHRIAISGTPIQNDLKELWSLFDFVFPGRLGTLPAFDQEFATPIRRGGYSNASPMQVHLAYRCAITLRDLIEPFLLRRLKKDIKEVNRMPKKTEHILFCRLSSRQRDMYEAYLRSDEVTRVTRGTTQMFAAVTMLRKICNHPDLVCNPDQGSFESFFQNKKSKTGFVDDYDEDFNDSDELDHEESLIERSGKLEVLSKVLPLWKRQGHRVLIFCQWRKMLSIIQRFVMFKGWSFKRLDGNTNVAIRQRLVDDFNNDESCFAMLCTTRTGGVGLNLTGANRIILYDPDWNPSTDQQARERVWRFGQERDVTIYRLITAGSIEEKIYHRQIFKTALSNKVLQDPRQRRLFSSKDLKDLFTLSADTGSVRSGGDGMTETVKATRGVGVIDGDGDLSAVDDSENRDNEDTLRKIMKSKGLAGIFDHHSIENDPSRKTTTAREMEEEAKRVARDALNAINNSVLSNDRFTPTWTGSKETKSEGRFGPASIGFESDNTIRNNMASGVVSSSSLLASLKLRQNEPDNAEPSHETKAENDSKYTNLLVQLKDYVRQQSPTTDEILEEFRESVADSEVAIFRRLLKSVAMIDSGRWYLK